ncbi:hypothetical protein APHAL10511_002761 [Amanita phalloides]|nr:hypothetical protein APHAL10511_002761 [Amanita phalloides]
MAPLAGRPPYAINEPDSIYETPRPTHTIRQQPPENPDKRTTAYNMYDNYLGDNSPSKDDIRQSGIGALGAGLLAMDDEDEDEDEDDNNSSESISEPPASKNAALAAATAPVKAQNQHQMNIAAPRPGYAAPIAALNNIPSPEPAAVPQGRRPSGDTQVSMPNPFVRPSIENPFNPPSPEIIRAQYANVSPSPSHPPSPHPLQPPMTPITPVFARPAKPTVIGFDEKPRVTRTERTVLPSRGEKGDDFWKRFSMVAKEPSARAESKWLKETRSGSSQLSRWVWCAGIILLIGALGAIGIWVYISHISTTHSMPTAVGGSAGETATTSSTPTVVSHTSSSVPHVSPTNTVQRREISDAFPTPVDHGISRRAHQHKNRMINNLL